MSPFLFAGWEKRFGGLSDSDLPTSDMKLRMRDWLSPDKEMGDSDIESVASVTSSAFSTQSERPRGYKYVCDLSIEKYREKQNTLR